MKQLSPQQEKELREAANKIYRELGEGYGYNGEKYQAIAYIETQILSLIEANDQSEEREPYVTIGSLDPNFDQKAGSLDAGEHPEAYCNDCGQRNPTWYAPNELWNTLCERHEIICPVCFQKRAEAARINIIFTTEDLKKHPVLDAGEWFNDSPWVTSDLIEIDERTLGLNTEVFFECLQSFAQASITARESEWAREKAELVKHLENRDTDVEALNQRIEWKDEKIDAYEYEIKMLLTAYEDSRQQAIEYRVNKLESLLKKTQ